MQRGQHGKCADTVEKPQRAGGLTGLQCGGGKRAECQQISLRDEDDAGDREDDQQPNGKQQIDRAGGDPVLQQRKKYERVYGIALQAPSFTSTSTAARASWPL
jgi:hypothetical protein